MIYDERLSDSHNWKVSRPRFRGLDKKGKWIEGTPCVVTTDTDKRVGYLCKYIKDATGHVHEVMPKTVTKFSGQYDCKRTPIYEGDIVLKDHKYQRVVIYADLYCAFLTIQKDHIDYLGKGTDLLYNVEVIGNIFQREDKKEVLRGNKVKLSL